MPVYRYVKVDLSLSPHLLEFGPPSSSPNWHRTLNWFNRNGAEISHSIPRTQELAGRDDGILGALGSWWRSSAHTARVRSSPCLLVGWAGRAHSPGKQSTKGKDPPPPRQTRPWVTSEVQDRSVSNHRITRSTFHGRLRYGFMIWRSFSDVPPEERLWPHGLERTAAFVKNTGVDVWGKRSTTTTRKKQLLLIQGFPCTVVVGEEREQFSNISSLLHADQLKCQQSIIPLLIIFILSLIQQSWDFLHSFWNKWTKIFSYRAQFFGNEFPETIKHTMTIFSFKYEYAKNGYLCIIIVMYSGRTGRSGEV